MKFYAVKKGRTPGIYRTWDAAKEQIDGFSGAEYKSFEQITDATDYLDWNAQTQSDILQKGEDNLQNAVKRVQQKSQEIKKAPRKKAKQYNHVNSNPADFFAVTYTDGGTRNTGV